MLGCVLVYLVCQFYFTIQYEFLILYTNNIYVTQLKSKAAILQKAEHCSVDDSVGQRMYRVCIFLTHAYSFITQ